MHYKTSGKYAAESPAQTYSQLSLRSLPRERAMTHGVGHLSDLELVQALLGTGTSTHSLRHIATEVLETLEQQRGKPSVHALLEIDGMGVARSVMVCAAMELARRLYHPARIRVSNPVDVLPILRHYSDRNQEYFLCISLNGAHEVIACRVVTIGLLNRALIHPRELFADPLADRAAAVIIAHNHPSGNVDPSLEDHDVTERLVRAGELLGIPVLDHLIFSDAGHASLRELGLL